METCLACGLETPELAAHSQRAHNLDPLSLERIAREGRRDFAAKIESQLRSQRINVVELTPTQSHAVYSGYVQAMREGGYL